MNILIIGECGVGKTWLMKQVLADHKLRPGKIGKIKFHYNDDIILIGVYDGSTFEGSDRLSMSLNTDLDNFLLWARSKIVICEGDRFTNSTFITKAEPVIFKIQGNGEAGRLLRGSKQTERHLKSIATRVSNIEAHVTADDSNEAYWLLNRLIKLDEENDK